MNVFNGPFAFIWGVALFCGWEVFVIWLCVIGDAPGLVMFALICAPAIFVGYLGVMRTPRAPRFHPDVRPPTSDSSQRVTRQ